MSHTLSVGANHLTPHSRSRAGSELGAWRLEVEHLKHWARRLGYITNAQPLTQTCNIWHRSKLWKGYGRPDRLVMSPKSDQLNIVNLSGIFDGVRMTTTISGWGQVSWIEMGVNSTNKSTLYLPLSFESQYGFADQFNYFHLKLILRRVSWYHWYYHLHNFVFHFIFFCNDTTCVNLGKWAFVKSTKLSMTDCCR